MKIALLTLTVVVGVACSCPAQPASAPPKTAVKSPADAPTVDDPRLPRILLIGDSISMGYTAPVQKLLQGRANVHRIPGNGGPTTNGLANLSRWLGNGKWDVIHFNWGLHDLKFMPDGRRQVEPQAYDRNLRELVRQLKTTEAKLIWATTTPVPEGVSPPRTPADVADYNLIAQKIMTESQIGVDDLYNFALPQLAEIQRPANVHFTARGSDVLAKQVAASIESALAGNK